MLLLIISQSERNEKTKSESIGNLEDSNMKKGNSESERRNDKEEIMEIVGRLPPEYVRKVLIFARTLENIFSAR